jgi:hypothetical protein
MDLKLLEAGRTPGLWKFHRILLTIPTVLARGETFALRISAMDAYALPDVGFEGEIVFEGSQGVDGLGPSVRLCKADRGAAVVEGLTATGEELAIVRARLEPGGHPLQSNPAWVFSDPPYRVYWGDLHVHTTDSNCHPEFCRSPEFMMQYARDVTHLDFVAAADHLRGLASDPARWPGQQEWVRRYSRPGSFMPVLAFESSHAQGYGGDNNVYFLEDDAPYFWLDREDMKGNSPKVTLRQLWDWLDATGKTYFTAPHHTGRSGKYRTFGQESDVYDPKREWAFEIYSGWGSSEARWTRYPIHGFNNDDTGYFVDALRAGTRFGVIASSDDHTTTPGGESPNGSKAWQQREEWWRLHQGLAGIRCKELTREALFEAIRRRDTLGVTFSRWPIEVKIGQASMGQEVPVSSKDAMRNRREITVRFSRPQGQPARVALMRNGQTLSQKISPHAPIETVEFVDEAALDEICIRDAMYHPEGFAVYYVRIETATAGTAWTSPIWLDLI